MIDRVVVAFDGSDLAREAFAYAVMLAEVTSRPRPLKVHAVHVLEPDPPPMIVGDPGLVDPTPIIRQREADREKETEWARREFAEMAKLCRRRGVEFSEQIETGALLETVCDIASAHDLIAVGRKGRFKRSGLGSTTSALLRHAPGPVLVVSGEMRPVNRVLVVFDGSSVSKRAVAEAEEFAQASGWPLTTLAAAGHGHDLSEALQRAQELAPEAQVISLSETEQRDEAKLIEHAASADHYALLFMGAYPESMLHRLLFGGATERVLSNLGAPVVLVR
jgi:nucleotide-binding universal stress UspA family protein